MVPCIAVTSIALTLGICLTRARRVYSLIHNPRYEPEETVNPSPLCTIFRDLFIHKQVTVPTIIPLVVSRGLDRITALLLNVTGLTDSDRTTWFLTMQLPILTENQYYSALSTRLSTTNSVVARSIDRSVFKNTPFKPTKVTTTHTHPNAAGERNAQVNFFRTLAMNTGKTLFIEQASAADQRKGIRGSRKYHWTKDLTVAPQNDDIVGPTLIGMVDVDYYIDMEQYLAHNRHTVVIYTIQPSAPAGTMNDTIFKFEDNHIVTSVTGGARFKHQLWDYGQDNITCTSQFTSLDRQDEVRTTTYLVERRTISPHRQIILLVPIGSWTGFNAILAQLLHTSKLKRMEPKVGDSNVIHTHGLDGHMVSVSYDGSFESVTIPSRVYEILAAAARNSKMALTAASIESHLPRDASSKGNAQILRNHFNNFVRSEVIVYPVEESIEHYTFNPEQFDQDEIKQTLFPYCSPIVGTLPPAPTSCIQNDERCVKSRVTDIQHTKDLPINNFLSHVMREFIEFMIPTHIAGTLNPVDEELVYEKQCRPSQLRTLEEADTMGDNYSRTVKSFQKKEAYTTLNDPRNISTICGRDKLKYSCYYYAVSDYLKNMRWYTFGKSPKNIALRIADICQNSEYMALGDFSRMDGRVSNVGRALTRAILLRLFHPQYHEELSDLMLSQINRKCFTVFGISFNSLMTRLSGSPETSGHNTMENAFCAYLGYRMTKLDGSFMTPEDAWNNLLTKCEFGGDDSAMGDMPEESYAKAAALLGHKVTCDVVVKGDLGVNFLSRFYGPDVWYGDANSMCDLSRTLNKFHTTTDRFADSHVKMTEKSLSVAYTDSHTPIIGRYVRLWLSTAQVAVPHKLIDTTTDTSWWSAQFDRTEQFINEPADWMMDYALKAYPYFDHDAFANWNPRTTVEILHPPLFSPHEENVPAKVDVVVNGEIRRVDPETPPPVIAEEKCGPSDACKDSKESTPLTVPIQPIPSESPVNLPKSNPSKLRKHTSVRRTRVRTNKSQTPQSAMRTAKVAGSKSSGPVPTHSIRVLGAGQ